LENWYAWKEEWPDWRPVQEVAGITEMIYRVMHVSPPAPPRGTEFPQFEDMGSLSITNGEYITRAQKRFNKRMQVLILGDDEKQFKTHTRDVSVGGLNLEDSLPEWANGYFKVRIMKPNSKQIIELMCCLVENQKPNERHRLAILPLQSQQDEQNLEAWLAA
jgi:hypothetical protein